MVDNLFTIVYNIFITKYNLFTIVKFKKKKNQRKDIKINKNKVDINIIIFGK